MKLFTYMRGCRRLAVGDIILVWKNNEDLTVTCYKVNGNGYQVGSMSLDKYSFRVKSLKIN